VRWTRPDGSVYTVGTLQHGKVYSGRYWWYITPPPDAALGRWTVALLYNGQELARDTFRLTTDPRTLAGTFRLAAQYYTTEGSGYVTVTVYRTGAAGTASVRYTTSPGSAAVGSDYASTGGTLVFRAGEVRKTFRVAIRNDR
jgi:hypothetical protein